MEGNPYLIDGSASPDSPWSHYVMDEVSAKTAGTPVYNPYLEGVLLPDGPRSSCASCYAVAAYHKSVQPTDATCFFQAANVKYLNNLHTPDIQTHQAKLTPPVCTAPAGSVMSTDSVWDLAESNNAKTSQ